eukprot:g4901.t1
MDIFEELDKWIEHKKKKGLASVFPLLGEIEERGLWTLVKECIVPGLTVGCMVVPQGLSYALLAGLPPIYGLYSSTFALFIYALLGTSPTLAIGPVALVSLLTKGTIDGELSEDASEDEIIDLAVSLAFLVGTLQCIFGVLGLGKITSFLSHDVLTGFTSGSAIIIAFSQMKYIFGIEIDRHHYPWETMIDVFKNLKHTDGNELAVSISCLALLISMKVWRKRNPAPKKGQTEVLWKQALRMMCSMSALVVVAIYTPLAGILNLYDIELKIVGSQPEGIKSPAAPSFSTMFTSTVFMSALVIAIIGFMESYAVAVSTQPPEDLADGKGVEANTDLVALGLSNVVGSFFNGYPIAGSFGRTAVSSRSGAKSTLSGAITAIFVIIVLLAMMPLFKYLPYCALACIIEVAVTGLIDVRSVMTAYRVSKSEFWVTLGTFVGVLALGIEIGVLIGAGLSIAFVLRRAAAPHMVQLGKVDSNVPEFGGTWRDTTRFKDAICPSETIILRVDAAIFFPNCGTIQSQCLTTLKEWEDLQSELGVGSGAKIKTHMSLPVHWEPKVVPDTESGDETKSAVAGDKDVPALPLDDRVTVAPHDSSKADDESPTARLSTAHGDDIDDASPKTIKRFILHVRNVEFIDYSGLHMIHHLDEMLESRGILFGISKPIGPVRDTLKKASRHHVLDSGKHAPGHVPLENRIYSSIDAAIAGLKKIESAASSASVGTKHASGDAAISVELSGVSI